MPEDMGISAVAEPIESGISEQTVDTTVDTGGEGELGSDSIAEVDSSQANEDLTAKPGQKSKVDLASVAKTSAEALKAINPALPAALRTAAFEQAGLYREFPGGLKEAVALKTTLGEYGGVEGLKESAEALSDYASLESMFEKGEGAFMERLADALPESFSQIMPGGLAKWKAVDAEGYNHNLAKVMTQTLDGVQASETLAAIWRGMEDGEAKTAIEKLWNALDGFRKLGDKAPERKVDPKNDALSKREQALAERESRALMAPIANEGRQQIQTITDREMTASYQWDKTDPSVKEAVMDRVRSEVVNASKKDTGFGKEFDRLKGRGDAAGLSRHVKNFQERVTPKIVERVAKLFAVKPKMAGAPAKKAAVTTTTTAKPAVQGWTRINRQPSVGEYDRRQTTDDMILSNRAVLKDGRRVEWA